MAQFGPLVYNPPGQIYDPIPGVMRNVIPGGIVPGVPSLRGGNDLLGAPTPPAPNAPAGATTPASGFIAWADRNIPFLGAMDDSVDLNPNTPGSLTSSTSPLASAASAIAFITDIPRVTTALIGIVLIIAGIFALTRGPAVQIVTTAARETLTS